MAISNTKTSNTKTSNTKTSNTNVDVLNQTLKDTITKAKGLGIDTSKAESVSRQTDRQGGTPYAGSREQTAYNTITAESVKPVTPVTLPTTPIPTNPGATNLTSNPFLEQIGTTVKDNQYVFDPTKSNAVNAATEAGQKQQSNLDIAMQRITGIMPQNTENDYLKRERDAGIQQLQGEVNNYTGQINSIVKNAQAESLGLEGQGRGITESIIGGQQARINREAAIQALPIQAQLDAAQGNLDSATARLDKLFTMHREDVKQKFDFQKGMIEAVLKVANDTETNILNAKYSDISKKEARIQKNIDTASEWAKIAIQTGQSNLITAFTSLDPKSATFNVDFGKLQARVVDPNVGLDLQLKQTQIKQANANLYTESLQQKKLLAELNPTNNSNNDDMASYGQQYADTGKLPTPSELKQSGLSISQVTSYAKQIPKPNGALVSTNTGTKSSALSDKQFDGIVAMNEIVNQSLPELKRLFPKLYTGLLGGIGGKLPLIGGSQDRSDYETFRADFLSKLLVARSGAAVTEREYDRYANLLPTTFNQPFFFGTDGSNKLNSLETSMRINLDNSLKTHQQSIYGYSKVDVPRLGKKTVGDILDIGGVKYKVLPDGSLTDVI